MSYKKMLELSRQAAEITAASCSSCAAHGKSCCSGCAHTHGYLNVPHKQFEALKLRFGWDADAGFATNVGCRLPREMRSLTCIEYYCEFVEKKPAKMNYIRFEREARGLNKAGVLPVGLRVALIDERYRGPTEQEWRSQFEERLEGRNSV